MDRPHTFSAPVHEERHAFSFRTPQNTALQAKMRHPTFVLIPSPTPQASVNIPPQRPQFVKIAPRPPPMARSTLHYRLKVEREEADSGFRKTKKYKPRTKGTTCGKCKKLRDNTTHSQYNGVWSCEENATESKEQWLRGHGEEVSVGPDNIPGFDKVEQLADYLMTFSDDAGVINESQARRFIAFWNELDEYDKTTSKQNPRFQLTPPHGRFKSKKTKSNTVVPGIESTRR